MPSTAMWQCHCRDVHMVTRKCFLSHCYFELVKQVTSPEWPPSRPTTAKSLGLALGRHRSGRNRWSFPFANSLGFQHLLASRSGIRFSKTAWLMAAISEGVVRHPAVPGPDIYQAAAWLEPSRKTSSRAGDLNFAVDCHSQSVA